ncbi:MAG: histidine kinase [Crocinitomicaceae bacterium]|nr:histidine kinase [Crocinitomicaceae bacterium]
MILLIILIACLGIIQFAMLQIAGIAFNASLIASLSLFILTILFVNLIFIIQRYYHTKTVLNVPNMSSLLLFTGFTIFIHYIICATIIDSSLVFINHLQYTLFIRSLVIFLIYTICLMLFWIDQQNVLEKRIQEFAIKKEREAIRIELNSLQQQFKPHFLFNSLNSINALTITNPEEARKMVHLLSEFMRGAIRENPSEKVSLAHEINHIKLYTNIEKVRFGNRLTVHYDIPEETLALKVPSLIVQPIIENAIKYGLYGHTEDVDISIASRYEDGKLIIQVSNPYDEETQSNVRGTGYGLQSIEKKMLILYGRSNLLELKKEKGTFITILTIPQQ